MPSPQVLKVASSQSLDFLGGQEHTPNNDGGSHLLSAPALRSRRCSGQRVALLCIRSQISLFWTEEATEFLAHCRSAGQFGSRSLGLVELLAARSVLIPTHAPRGDPRPLVLHFPDPCRCRGPHGALGESRGPASWHTWQPGSCSVCVCVCVWERALGLGGSSRSEAVGAGTGTGGLAGSWLCRVQGQFTLHSGKARS